MAPKLTHEFVKAAFEQEGYTLLSDYIDSKSKLDFRCDKGHLHQISWNYFNSGNRCGICSGRYNINDEVVKAAFEAIGYEALSPYVNNSTPIKFRCDKGHLHQISWGNFSSGKRCRICAGNQKLTHEFVANHFRLAHYEILSEYINGQEKISFRCDKGHIGKVSWNKFSQGRRCRACATKNQADGQRLSLDFVKAEFNLANYEVLGGYVGAQTPIKFRCDKGHIHEISWSNFSRGVRCGICSVEHFYKKPGENASRSIVRSICREIKKQSITAHWSYFYSEDQIKAIAEPIQEIYKTCPNGHAVDHIVPVSAFNLLNEKELIACWSPDNLRHLDAIANIKRSNKITVEEVEYMRSNYPEIINAASRLALI